ncbi:MAG TPA: DUF2950 family protein [Planctomycetota bacterium]|nr:DUF2950 family protein [Planctomycetota bacterium]
MRFTTREMLLSLAVAGAGTGLYTWWYKEMTGELNALPLMIVLVMLFGATLLGMMLTRDEFILPQRLVALFPLCIAAVMIVIATHSIAASKCATNQTRAAYACKDFATAQKLYLATDWNKDGTAEYASTLKELSAKGLISQAIADAEFGPGARPYHGYYFRVLMRQGNNAPGGAKDYLDAQGRLTGGAALVAFSDLKYEGNPLDLFITYQNETVFQYNFGVDTPRRGREMMEFDPGTEGIQGYD